jgi:chromosome partitioning protein
MATAAAEAPASAGLVRPTRRSAASLQALNGSGLSMDRVEHWAPRPETGKGIMQSNRVIVFASQKGGSGKTTLSGHIAVQAQLSGAGPVAIIDTDPQRSLAQWRYAREDNEIILKVSDVENIENDIAELKALGAAVIVIDTPPAATSAIGEVVRHADLVCIPTRPSPHDLRAVGATIDIVESHRKPMIFVLNSAAARAKITSEAALALSQHGTVAPAIVHNRVDFAASMTDGRTVMEVDEGTRSAQEIKALWDYIETRMERNSAMSDEAPAPEPAAAASEQVAAAVASAPKPEPEPAPEPAPVAIAPEPAPAPVAAATEPQAAETTAPDPVAAEATMLDPAAVPAAAPEPAMQADAGEPPSREATAPMPPATRTPTAEEFFAQRRMIKTPTYFGPDRRHGDLGAPGGLERRAPTFGRRTS